MRCPRCRRLVSGGLVSHAACGWRDASMPDPNSPEMMRARAQARERAERATREVSEAHMAKIKEILKPRALSREERAGGGAVLSEAERSAAAKLERLRKAYPT